MSCLSIAAVTRQIGLGRSGGFGILWNELGRMGIILRGKQSWQIVAKHLGSLKIPNFKILKILKVLKFVLVAKFKLNTFLKITADSHVLQREFKHHIFLLPQDNNAYNLPLIRWKSSKKVVIRRIESVSSTKFGLLNCGPIWAYYILFYPVPHKK